MGVGKPRKLGRATDAHYAPQRGLHMIGKPFQFGPAASQHNMVFSRIGKAHFLQCAPDLCNHGVDPLRYDGIQLRARNLWPFGLRGIARRAHIEALLMIARGGDG